MTPPGDATAHLLSLAGLARTNISVLAGLELPAVTDATSLPLEGSRSGSIMTDRIDPSLRWYVPAYALAGAADPAFSFAAAQGALPSSTGDPFDTAVLSLGLTIGDPPDLAAARTANPSLTFKAVPVTALEASLSLQTVASDGTTQTASYPATVTPVGDAAVTATVTLQGPAVIVAFLNLVEAGTAIATLSVSFQAWREVRTFYPGPPPVEEPLPRPYPMFAAPAVRRAAVGAVEAPPAPMDAVAEPRIATAMVRPAEEQVAVAPTASVVLAASVPAASVHTVPALDDLPRRIPIDPLPRQVTTFVQVLDTDSVSLPLASVYARDPLRSRYTITANGQTRAIIDVRDLSEFATVRSEFRELVSLGHVPDRYPSIRSLYLGQVSGTVLAIPATYAVVHGSTGCAARCEAVVDDSPVSLSGCRFELTFTLAPAVDPVDMARLANDLPGTPEAAHFTLGLALPDGLDPRTSPVFTGLAAGKVTVVDGPTGTLHVDASLTDDGPTPALTNVNLLLHELVASSGPLTGQVAVHLDDAYPTPVTTSAVLNFGTTVGTDDLAVVRDAQSTGQVLVTNAGPLDLHLLDVTTIDGSSSTTSPLDVVLPSTGTMTVPAPAVGALTIVRRRLDVPNPLPAGGIFRFLTLDVQTVQQLQYPLGFNATAVDFGAAGIRQLDLQPSLVGLPSLTVSPLTLTADHRVDSIHVTVPIGAAVVALTATIDIAVTQMDGATRHVQLTHDFLDDPVAVLLPAQLAPPPG